MRRGGAVLCYTLSAEGAASGYSDCALGLLVAAHATAHTAGLSGDS